MSIAIFHASSPKFLHGVGNCPAEIWDLIYTFKESFEVQVADKNPDYWITTICAMGSKALQQFCRRHKIQQKWNRLVTLELFEKLGGGWTKEPTIAPREYGMIVNILTALLIPPCYAVEMGWMTPPPIIPQLLWCRKHRGAQLNIWEKKRKHWRWSQQKQVDWTLLLDKINIHLDTKLNKYFEPFQPNQVKMCQLLYHQLKFQELARELSLPNITDADPTQPADIRPVTEVSFPRRSGRRGVTKIITLNYPSSWFGEQNIQVKYFDH